MKSRTGVTWRTLALSATVLLMACGGAGGGNSTTESATPSVSEVEIVTSSLLPPAVQNKPYSATLTARGTGTITWKMTPYSLDGRLDRNLVSGLELDANTGLLSGTPSYTGELIFAVQATDSRSGTATKGIVVRSYPELVKKSDIFFANVSQYQFVPWSTSTNPAMRGGVPPLKVVVSQGSLPRGVYLDANSGFLAGSPVDLGHFQSVLTVRDSYFPPQSISLAVDVTVSPTPLTVASSLPSSIALNMPFEGQLFGVGGKGPYSFSLAAGGSLPPGLAFDPSKGRISGTPTTQGDYYFSVTAVDSQSPPARANGSFLMHVVPGRPRNDSIATATRLDVNTDASISPYIDPPNGTLMAGDVDYYKLRGIGDSVAFIEATPIGFLGNPLDATLELVDANNQRFQTCRLAASPSAPFDSPCMNHDRNGDSVSTDSALEFKVPGTPGDAVVFYARVFDWRGMARPDMKYRISSENLIRAVSVPSFLRFQVFQGQAFSQEVSGTGGIPPFSWALVSGTMPPGIAVTSSGRIEGTATTRGTFLFTLRASDAGKPPEEGTVEITFEVR